MLLVLELAIQDMLHIHGKKTIRNFLILFASNLE